MLPGETVMDGAPGAGEDKHVTPFKVMRSGAGYYVGTGYKHCPEDNACKKCKEEGMFDFEEPNSRETGYFEKYEHAEAVLKEFEQTSDLIGQRT